MSVCRSPAGAPLSGGLMRAGPRMPAFCRSNAFPKAALQAKAIDRRVRLSALPETACVYRFAVRSPVEAFAFACRTSIEPVGLQRAAGLFSPSRPCRLRPRSAACPLYNALLPRCRDTPVPAPRPARPLCGRFAQEASCLSRREPFALRGLSRRICAPQGA